MNNINRTHFQAFPYHLVEPSPWPILLSLALFSMTLSAVMYFHGFVNGGEILCLGFFLTLGGMILWFRDVVTEGTKGKTMFQNLISFTLVKIAITIPKDTINSILNPYLSKLTHSKWDDDQLGYYLAGLLEGDGNIYLPSLGKTSLNRILNPRITFTSHLNNVELYVYLQYRLGGIGRFQLVSPNTLRYIIGDVEGIKIFLHFIHGKLRTPKNITLNQLIDFINSKYSLTFPISSLNESDISSNSWLTGFTEADGYFGIKIIEDKLKSDTRKRSVSRYVSLIFRLDQRLIDKMTSLSLTSIMNKISSFLSCSLVEYVNKDNHSYLSVSTTALDKLEVVVNYFKKYPLLGNKGKDFEDWEKIYNLFKSKRHLTDEGLCIIRGIRSNMNKNRIIQLPLVLNALLSSIAKKD
jgi:LAGLIDADG endonuclease/Cytochrome c oxidase subunit III